MARVLDLSGLDESQKAFCSEPSRAVRLLAPAGAGKTYSLLRRCLAVVAAAGERERPRCLVFTFTRAARDELRDRLRTDPLFETIRSHVDISTLNSWGFRWLKPRLPNLRLVVSTQERFFCMTNLLQPCWSERPRLAALLTDNRRKTGAARALMDLSDRIKGLGFRHDKHGEFAAFSAHISWLQQNGMGAHCANMFSELRELELVDPPDAQVQREASDNYFQFWVRDLELVDALDAQVQRQAFDNYLQFWVDSSVTMYRSAMLTLEDQKYWALIELEQLPASGGMPRRYQHILVDEFQDINPLDLNLLRVLAQLQRTDLSIVGDDDQAIYEWRGATPEFILHPDTHCGGHYETYTLEVNYRSPRNIVSLSQALIRHNKRRVDKQVRAASQEDAVVDVLSSPSLDRSVDYVLGLVKRGLTDDGIRRIAIIGRKRSQIIPYQIVFAGAELPFYAAEDLQLFLSDAFNDLKALLLLKAQATTPLPLGPDPVEGLLKLCDKVKRYPLSKKDRGELKAFLVRGRPRTIAQAAESLYEYRGPLKGGNAAGEMSAAFYRAVRELLMVGTVAEAIDAISSHFGGLQKDYGKSHDDIFYADPPFLFLGEYARRYGTDYGAFYEDIEKAVATLARVPPEDEEDGDDAWRRPLHLMTALRAKGKEFDLVVLLDCNQGIWPSKLAKTEAELEAERRVFYVAFTRARRRLVLLVDMSIRGEVLMPTPYLTEMGLKITGSVGP